MWTSASASAKPDVQYVQFSYADMASALMAAGLSASFAGLDVEMKRLRRTVPGSSLNAGWIDTLDALGALLTWLRMKCK
jgi:hypothetical protein